MKKLTYELYRTLVVESTSTWNEVYESLLPYLADEQPAEHPTKPEPSRLEVAAMIAAHMAVNSGGSLGFVKDALLIADELIKRSKL